MAKPNAREGNSCHIHFSLRTADGGFPMAGDGPAHLSPLGESVLAGMLATMRDFSLMYAPNINSYKRYQHGSFAPTALRWGRDNRTCSLRMVGHTPAVDPRGKPHAWRRRQPVPRRRRHGRRRAARHRERTCPLEPECAGNAYDDADAPRMPTTLREALGEWEGSDLARDAFGARRRRALRQQRRGSNSTAFDAAVTDWELFRGFERL